MRAFKKIYSLTTNILVAVVVILAILLVGVRLVGLTPYTVLSGSMEPTYPVGSIIYVVKADPADLQVGDPLTYRMGGTVVTHRIIEVLDVGERQFRTQGDANDVADGSPVTAGQIVGKPLFCIPLLGFLSDFVQHPPGTYVTFGGLFLLILLFFIPDFLREEKKPEALPEGDDTDEPPTEGQAP